MRRTSKVSSKPKKQRKARFTANWAERRKRMSAPLSKQLREKLGVRSLPVRTGDHVLLVRGQNDLVGQQGRVTKVDYKRYRLIIDKVQRKKTDGTALPYPVFPSNVIITKLAKDKWRTGRDGLIARKGVVALTDEDLVEAPVMKAVEAVEEEEE